jgi:hypothetical protein
MSSMDDYEPLHGSDHAPGDEPAGRHEITEGVFGYLIGLGLAVLLTAVSFFIAGTSLVWHPSIPIALVVLAHHHWSRQRQQRAGAGVRRPDRLSDHGRFALDHVQFEPEYGADADADGIKRAFSN